MGAKGKPARENAQKILAFETWYSANKSVRKTREILGEQTPPIHVAESTLFRWIEVYGWDKRAHEREMEIAKNLAKKSMEEQEAFRRRQANLGRLMQQKATQYLQANSISNDFAAIQAASKGLELEKAGMGMPEENVVQGEIVLRIVREDED